jgi:hypothetical protein
VVWGFKTLEGWDAIVVVAPAAGPSVVHNLDNPRPLQRHTEVAVEDALGEQRRSAGKLRFGGRVDGVEGGGGVALKE